MGQTPAEYWKEWTIRTAQQKRGWLAKSKVCLHNYRCLFHTMVDTDGVRVLSDDKLLEGTFKVPLIPRYVDMAATSIMAEQSFWQAVPSGHGTAAKREADAKTLLLNQFSEQNSVHVNNVSLARNLIITGTGFKRLFLANEYVPVELPPDSLETYLKMKAQFDGRPVDRLPDATKGPDGRVRIFVKLPVVKEQVVSPFSMLPETGARDLEDCQRFVCHEERPISWIQNRFPNVDISRITPQAITDKHYPAESGTVMTYQGPAPYSQQTGDRFGSDARLVRVYDCWEALPTGKWVHTVYAGHEFIPLIEPEESNFIPYVDYHANKLDDYFWGFGLVERGLDLQRGINRSATDIKFNFHSLMKDVVILDIAQRSQPTNQLGSQVLYVNPRNGFKPQRLDMPTGTHTVLAEMMDRDEALLAKVFGFSDASLGVVKSHVSAQSYQLSQKVDASPLQMIRTQMDESEKRKNKKVLEISREIFDEPRFVACSGTSLGSVYANTIKRTDLSGSTDITLIDSVPIPKAAADRFGLMERLMNSGAFAPENAGAVEAARKFLRIETGLMPEPQADILEEERAQAEALWIESGFIMPGGMMLGTGPAGNQMQNAPLVYMGPEPSRRGQPLLRDTDIDEIHLDNHLNDIRSGRFTGPALDIAWIHIQEHQSRIDQTQARQMAKQLELQAQQSMAQQAGQFGLQAVGAAIDAVRPRPEPKTPNPKSGDSK